MKPMKINVKQPNFIISGVRYGLLLGLGLLLLVGPVSASSGGAYDLAWLTVDAGGGASDSGEYALAGTAGQPDAGPLLTGGQFTVSGGFWAGQQLIKGNTGVGENDIFLPLIVKSD